MYDASIPGLRSNQRFLVHELEQRGVEVVPIDILHGVLQAEYRGHRELLLDIDSSLMPFSISTICGHKQFAKDILARAGLEVPRGEMFESVDPAAALEIAERIGYPVVLKPCQGANGDQVHLELADAAAVLQAAADLTAARAPCEALVEEFFQGQDVKIFVTRRGDFCALHRKPPSVTGDGRSTLRALIDAETARRREPDINRLAPILIDQIAGRFLAKQGLTLDSVPHAGVRVTVRPNANIGSGGVSEDCTETVHPGFIELAKQALEAFPGMPYAGVDFQLRTLQAAPDPGHYRILEINPLPSLGIHMMPARGTPRNAAAMVADLIFPETALQS